MHTGGGAHCGKIGREAACVVGIGKGYDADPVPRGTTCGTCGTCVTCGFESRSLRATGAYICCMAATLPELAGEGARRTGHWETTCGGCGARSTRRRGEV